MLGVLKKRAFGGAFMFGAVLFSLVLTGGPSLADTLKGAMLKAYRSNPTLQAGRARLRGTDEAVPQAKSGWRPTIRAQGSVSQSWINTGRPAPLPSVNSSRFENQLSIQLNQPLFRGFKTVESVKQAKSAVEAGRAQLADTEQRVLLQVADAYLSVVRDRRILELRKKNVENLQKQVRAATARFEAGEVTRTDVSQAKARVSGAKANVASAKATLASSTARYESLVGDKPGSLVRPKAAHVPHSLDSALAIARKTNPNILAAEHARHAAVHGIEVIKGDLLPEANLIARADRIAQSETSGGRNTKTDRTTASIEGVVTIPLYEGGRVYSAVREAKQLESQRTLEIIASGRAVRQGVKIAWSDLQASREAIDSAEAQVRSAQLSLDGVTQEYLVGSRSTIDVLNAEQELVNARVTLYSAEYSYLLSSYELMAAIGHMTARKLDLGGPYYDPKEHYNSVKGRYYGLDADTLH